jgi:hypothetical protein
MYANAAVLSTDRLNVFADVTFYDFSAFHPAYRMVIAEPTVKPQDGQRQIGITRFSPAPAG